jgi:phosphate transport system substrate-binding protein
MLVHENLDANNAIGSREEAEELVRFVLWAITDGQELSEPLGFARLPEAAVNRNLDMIRQIKWQGEPIGEDILNETTAAGN